MSSISSVSGLGGGSGASAYASMRPAHSKSKAAEEMFSALDTDGDGQVSEAELEAALGNGPVAAEAGDDAANILGAMDTDGSGSLSESELQAGLQSLAPPAPSTFEFAASSQASAAGEGPSGPSASGASSSSSGGATSDEGSGSSADMQQSIERLVASMLEAYARFAGDSTSATASDAGASSRASVSLTA